MATSFDMKDSCKVLDCFCNNPVIFYDIEGISKEDFFELILKLLKNECLEESWKLRCLIIIQDFSSILFCNTDQIHIVLKLLRTLFHKHHEDESEYFFKGQLLIAMTTLMITILDDMAEKDDRTLSSFVELFDDMIQLLLMANDGKNYLLREAACECLLEMEIEYPGLLFPILDTLRDLCISENSFIYEKYSLLFTTVLKHQQTLQMESLSQSQELIQSIIKYRHQYQSMFTSSPFSEVEVKRSISYLLEHLPFISSFIASAIMRDCTEITKKSILISIFKPVVLNYLHTYNVQLLNVILHMQMKFGKELFIENNENHLLSHLVHLAYLPSLASSQRLLYLDWLEYYFVKKIFNNASNQLFLKIYPSCSDNWEIIQKKLNLFSSILKSNSELFNKDAHKIYWECLSAVYNTAQFVMNRRSASAIFRGLFLYMKHYSVCTEVQTNIQRIVFSFTKYQPSFFPHTTDFIRCIKEEFPESSFPYEMQKELVKVIISLDLTLISLQYYILFLNNLIIDVSNVSLLKDVCHFLQLLLSSSTLCEDGDWILGNQLLRVCRNLLHHQDFRYFFTELGDVLNLIIKAYSDTDIREEARFLYMLLTSLSPQKIKSTFAVASEKQRLGSLSILETDFELDKINFLKIPMLHLKKTDKFTNIMLEEDSKEGSIPKNTLKPYRAFIGSDDLKSKIELECLLHMDSKFIVTNRKLRFQNVYCIHITFEKSPLYDDITEIVIPYLSQDKLEECSFTLSPKSFEPFVIQGSAIFSSEDGSTYQCPIKEIEIEFENYFLPLPVPETYINCVKSWRSRVYDDLWLSFSKSSKTGRCQESVIWLALSAAKLEEKLNKFKHLIIGGEKNEGKVVSKVGIFLSVGCHILLKFEADEDNDDCVVRIMVDNWQTLGLLNMFILSLE